MCAYENWLNGDPKFGADKMSTGENADKIVIPIFPDKNKTEAQLLQSAFNLFIKYSISM